MATEAYIPQFIPATKKEGEGRELSSEPLNSEFNELPQEEMQKAEHRPNKPLEILDMGETENMQVATNINVDTTNAVTQSDVGTVEDEVFIAASSVPKVSCLETSTEDEKSSASIIAVGKEMDAEVTKQSEETEEEINEKEETLQFSTKSVCISTEKEEGAKENLGGPSVAALIEETSSKKAEQDEGGKLEDNSSIQFDERSTKIAESTERVEHEEQSEQSFLTKVEPGKEKLEKSLDADSEEISDNVSVETTAVFEEQGPIESFEEIIKEEKKETTYQADDMEKERSEEKNLPQDGVNEKIEKEEDGKTEESASDSYFTDLLVNETVHLGGEKQDQDSSAEPEHGDEFKTTCANQGIREHLQEEENKIENQALTSTREEKTAESSKKDETMEEVPKQEMDKILRKADSQMIEQNGTRDIFASTVSKESKEETSFGKNEEKGPNDEVPEANEEGKETTTLTKKETDNDKECTESIEEKTIQESPREVETREENKSAQPNVEAENQSIEEINNANVPSSTAADRNTEENVNEKEAEVMESEEENSVTEPMELIFDTTCPPEETKAKTLKDGEENDAQSTTGASRELPSEETTENRVENSSVPHVYVEEMGEEILHKAETPVTWVTEETGLKEVSPEDKMQSERFDPVSDKCVPDGANAIAKNVEATDFGENENMQIQTAAKDGAAEVGEKEVFEAQCENHDPSPTLNDEREVSTGETIQDYIAEQNVKEPFAPSSTEGTHLTTEAIGITNETSEKLEASYVSTCSPLAGEITEEKILQAQEKFVDPEVHACVASSDVEKASPNEEVHDEDDPQLQVTPAPNTETTISESEGVELTESIKTSEASYVSTHAPLAVETTEEKMLQVQEKFIDPEVHAFMASSDVEKASANEEVPDDGQQLHVTPAPNTETTITELEGVELPESIKTSEASYVSTHVPLAAETTEEKILQVQEKFMNPEVHAIRASSDVEKVSPDEEVYEVGQQLYMTPAPNTETTIIKSEGVELPESIKTSEVADSSHIGELETSKDEKSTKLDKDKLEDENPVNDTSIEERNTSTVTKEALLSQEYSKGSSDEDAEIEKPVVEVETGGHSHEVGVSETKSTKDIAEEVPVTTEEGQDTITPVIEESESDKHCITHSIEQKTVQDSAQEAQTRVDDDTAQANTETENQTAEETATANLPSSTSVEKTIEESFKVEERDVLESTEEIKNSGMEKMEQNFDTKCTSEDTKDETLKDAPESDTQCTTGTSTVLPKETNEDFGEKFAVPHVYEEQTGEEILRKAETTVTEENEVPKGEKLQEYTSEENLKEPHILPSRELNLTTSEATDKTDEIQEEVASYVDTHTPLAKEPTEEKQLQIEDESTGPEVRTYMASENEIVHEEDQQLHVTPALDTETRFAESEDVELPKSIKASEVADSTNTGNTEISKDEKWPNTESEKDKVEDPRPVNDGSNEACDASTQIEKTVIEEEHSARNFRNSLKEDVNIEKEVGEVETGVHIQETGVHERKSTSTVKEEVPETTKEGPEMEMTDIQQNDSGKDWTTESIEEKTVQERFPKTEEIEKNKSTPANMETEDENKERTTEASLYSPTIAEKSIEESLEEEEKEGTKSKEEVKHSDRELLEQNFDARCPTEDTNVETLKDGAKPNQDSNTESTTDTSKVTPAKEPNEDLVENTSVPCVFEKETGEEILHKSETIVAGVTEEAVLKELNEEDKMQSDRFDLVSDNSPTTAESFEITPKINDERDVSTGEMLQDFISEQNPKEPYATSSIEHALLTSEATETTDVTPEKAGASYVSPHSPFGAETTEETTRQIQDMSTNPEVQADIASADMEKDGANEEVHDEDQQPQVIPSLNTDASITESGHVELLKISKTSEVTDCSKVGEVENFKDEKWLNAEPEKDKLKDPVNETSNEACNTSTETEKASQEQEHSARNVKSSPKEDVEIEKEAVELEAGDHVQDSEVSETNCTSTVTEEDPESIETREQPRSDSQSVTGDQSDKVIPLLDDVDIPAKLPQVSVLGENKNMEIPTAAKEEEAESEEKIDHEVQKETCDRSSKCEEEREVSAADTPPVYTAEQNLEDSSTVSSEEHNHVTTEASEKADGPQEKVEASSINTYAPSAADTIEDKLLQKQAEPTDPRDEAYLASIDTENSSANEEVHGDQEMYKARALNAEKNVTESQEVELQKSTETSDVTSGSDIAKWETSKVQKSLNDELDEEAEKTVTDAFNEAYNTSMEPETEVLEQVKDPDLVPTENPEVTNYSENKETVKSQAAESEAENQNIKTCPETNNANIEECSKSFKDLDLESVGQQVIGDDCQEGQREIYEETEPKFEATNQSKETLVGIEPIKNVTLNEEVPKAVEKAEESETRQTVEENNCRTEIETTLAPNEIANKITNPDQTPIDNLEVTDYSETAETLKLQDAKDLSREAEEDMKKDREKPVSITSSELELSAENIKETDIASIALNRELVELETNEQGRCATVLEAEDQNIQTLHETENEEDINSVKNMTLESTGEKIIGQDIQEGGTEMPEKMEPTLEPENQSEETQTTIERIKDVTWTEEVSGGTEKTKESEDIEVITKEESCILEHQMAVPSNEMIRDPAPRLTENLEATVSRENTETGKTLAAEDLDLQSKASSITEAPEEDTKKATEESTNITSSVSAISEDIFEEENTEETDGCNDKTNIAPLTLVTEDATSEEVQQEEKSKMDFDTTSDDKTQQVKTASTGLQGEKVDCEKLEDNSGLLSPLTAEGAVLNNESENLENKYGVEVEEPVTSDAISKSKEKDVEDIHGSHESPTADSTFEDKLEEEINEVREAISKPNHQGVNSVIAGEVLLHQILPSRSTEEETCSQKADPRELEVSNLKLELIEDPKNDSPNETPNEECISVGEATSLEPLENVSKINLVNSPPESEKSLGIEKTMHNSSKEASEEDAFNSCNSKNEAMDLPSHCSTATEISTIEVDEKCEEPSTLDFQKNEKALQSMYGEEPAKSAETETKDEQIITETTGPKAQGNQSGMTNEASETITNEIKSETATENELAKDSPVGSPDKETVRSNYEEDVQVAVGYPGEKKIQELEATTDAIQNEKLSKELESASLDEDDKKQVKGKDGDVEDPCPDSVGDRVVNEILQEEAEWKNAAEARTKLDIQKTSDDTYSRDTNIGATALSEEVTDSEFVFVKHDEGKESAINKETVTTQDVVEDALAEEAPPKVGQEVEEISEGAPKEPIHETIQAYDVKKDIEEERIHSSESLKDDEKPKHTTLESTFDGRDITDDLNLKEQDISANKARTSLPTESVQKETGDELNENKVNEEQSEIISDKQITAKMIIPEEVKCIKDEAENTKDEEEVDLSKMERTVEFDEAKIHGTINIDGDVETQDQSGKFDVLSQNKDSSMEITQSDRTVDLVEPYPNENTEAKVITGSKGVPHVQQETNTQTFQESEDLKSGNPSGAEPEAKEVERGEEIIASEERKGATEEYSSTESAKNSLSDLLERSTKGTSQVTKLLIEEREPKEGKQLQDDKAETADVEEAKEDEEEEGDEHKRVDSGSDAPVMVEASSDVHEKVAAHKKSHNILSGVGSKVKHSIAKVKKVITGKSSHPKPSSPK